MTLDKPVFPWHDGEEMRDYVLALLYLLITGAAILLKKIRL